MIVYLKPTTKALRFTRLSPAAFAENGSPIELEMDFPIPPKKKRVAAVGTASGENKGKKVPTTALKKSTGVDPRASATVAVKKSSKVVERQMLESEVEEWDDVDEIPESNYFAVDEDEEAEMQRSQRLDDDGWEVYR